MAAVAPAGGPDAAPPKKARRAWWKAVAAVVLVVAVAGVGFSLFRATKGGGGADTPELAVQNVATSVSKNDPIGLITTIDPEEVQNLGDVWSKAFDKAEKLGYGDLQPGRGSTFEISDLEVSSTPLSDDVAKVKIRSGKVSASISGLENYTTGTVPKSGSRETFNLKDIDADYRFVMAVRRDGRWYVSLLYTAAEEARVALTSYQGTDLGVVGWGKGFDLSKPKYGKAAASVDKAGADSPINAVKSMVEAANETDPEKILRYVSPKQFGAAYDYFDTFVTEQLSQEFTKSRRDYNWSVEDYKFSEGSSSGNRKRVIIESGTISWNNGGSRGSEHVEYDGKCINSSNGTELCKNDWDQLEKAFPGKLYIVVREDDGKWFIDPFATAIDYAVDILDHVDDNEIQGLLASAGVGKPKPIVVGQELTFPLADALVGDLYSFDAAAGNLYALKGSDTKGRLRIETRVPGQYSSTSAGGTVLVRAKDDTRITVQVSRRSDDSADDGKPSEAKLSVEWVDPAALTTMRTGESQPATLANSGDSVLYRLQPSTDSSLVVRGGGATSSSANVSTNVIALDGSGYASSDSLKSGTTYVALISPYTSGSPPGAVTASLDPKPGYLPSGDSSPVRLERGRSVSETLSSSSSSSSSSGVRNFYVVGDGRSWRVGLTTSSFYPYITVYNRSGSSQDSASGYPSSSSATEVSFVAPVGEVYVISVSSSSSSSSKSFTIGAE